MKMFGIYKSLFLLCGTLAMCRASRSFPVDAENYVKSLFTTINPSIKWDRTNYLVDLAGRYAHCRHVGRHGTLEVDRARPTAGYVTGVVDDMPGQGAHTQAVSTYIRELLAPWTTTSPYRQQILDGKIFGCSVQPGCNGHVVVACLFGESLGEGRHLGDGFGDDGVSKRGTGDVQCRCPQVTPPEREYEEFESSGEEVFPVLTGALAFTKEQYKLAEDLTSRIWDKSHYLENLSGHVTKCGMVGRLNWDFESARKMGKAKYKNSKPIDGIFGYALNLGSTQNAITEILTSWIEIPTERVGCSVIPDCMVGPEMYVVVACVYRDLQP